MPLIPKTKKPKEKQIHLARHVPHEFFRLVSICSAQAASTRALVNQYETFYDDSDNALDPYVDHQLAREFSDRIMAEQKAYRRFDEAVCRYMRDTGFSIWPLSSEKLNDDDSKQQSWMFYEREDLDPPQKSRTTKKVRFTMPVALPKPSSSFKLCFEVLRDKLSKIERAAFESGRPPPPLLLTWHAPFPVVRKDCIAPLKAKSKRLLEEDHYMSGQPVKYSKVWHETAFPEAYYPEDVGHGLTRPMTKVETASSTVSGFQQDIYEDLVTGREKNRIFRRVMYDPLNTCTALVPYQRKPIFVALADRTRSRSEEKEFQAEGMRAVDSLAMEETVSLKDLSTTNLAFRGRPKSAGKKSGGEAGEDGRTAQLEESKYDAEFRTSELMETKSLEVPEGTELLR